MKSLCKPLTLFVFEVQATVSKILFDMFDRLCRCFQVVQEINGLVQLDVPCLHLIICCHPGRLLIIMLV